MVRQGIIDVSGVLISSDIIFERFCCDLEKCKGRCCVEGDAGAPVTMDEVMEIENVLDIVFEDLSEKAQEVILEQGVVYNDREGDLVTSIVNGKDCVFTCYDKELCLCTFDRAHRAGRCSFRKPISCALYPIREKRFDDDLVGLNYHRWEVCKPAVKKGRELNLPLYRFLEGPLTERFGREWYAELCEVAESLKAEGEEGSKE